MYPPNYDMRGWQIVHDQHLKELRQEAEAHHLAEEFKQNSVSASETAQPSFLTRLLLSRIERLRNVFSARGDQHTPSAKRTRRTGFNSR